MRLLAVLLCPLLGCATPVTAPRSTLIAGLRHGGMALRPESRHLPIRSPWAPPAPKAPPPQLRRPLELQLLAGRIGLPPSLALGCAVAGNVAFNEIENTHNSCLGRPLDAPLQGAVVIEQVAKERVAAISAEESFPTPELAAAHFQALLRRLREVHGEPEGRGGQLLWRLQKHEVTLEELPRHDKLRDATAARALTLPRPFVIVEAVRILGLDVGSKTIGVAVSDELGLCAHVVKTLSRRGTKADVEQVRALCVAFCCTHLVVGLPYDCEGNEGHRAARVRVLGDALVQAGFAVAYQDESFSTVEAEQVLLDADLSRRRRKKVVDRLAAAVILQAWLDARPHREGRDA